MKREESLKKIDICGIICLFLIFIAEVFVMVLIEVENNNIKEFCKSLNYEYSFQMCIIEDDGIYYYYPVTKINGTYVLEEESFGWGEEKGK